LSSLADHPAVGEVRGGTGLVGAVELDAELLGSDPGAVSKAFRSARDAGVLLRPLASSLAVSPPLTITEAELDLITDGIRAGLDALTT
jgi:adenosylmethionine-8-amino-7-oxononanoate aminotransferase